MRLPDDVAEALGPLGPGYAGLLGRVVDVLVDDSRVLALWVTGSVGRGVADAGSDLDLVVTVTSAADLADLADLVSPSAWEVVDALIAVPIPGLAGLAFTTRDGLRLDVVLETPADLAGTEYRHRVRVFDHDGLAVPPNEDDGHPPDVARMQALATEFLRQSAIFPAAVVAREDWLLGQVAVQNYTRILYDLFVEANQPMPPMGVKQWSSRLTRSQRAVLAGLPPPTADRIGVLQAMGAARQALRTHGREALESVGGVWPVEVDDALDAVWGRHSLS